MKNNVLFRQVVNLLDDKEVWVTVFFVILAAFFSYSSFVAPQYRDEMVLGAIAGAVASATGVRGVLLAFASNHSDTVVELLNQAINALEKATGKNIIPDDEQALAMAFFKKELGKLKEKAETKEALAELQRIERQVNDLFPRG